MKLSLKEVKSLIYSDDVLKIDSQSLNGVDGSSVIYFVYYKSGEIKGFIF